MAKKVVKKNNQKEDNTKLIIKTWIRYFLSIVGCGVFLFGPAGSFDYWQAWVFLGTFFIPMGIGVIYMSRSTPDLLRRRMQFKEKDKAQKKYILYSWILMMSFFVVPALDYRFGWSHVPVAVVIGSAAFMFCGYLLFFTVMMQNEFASRIIEVQKEQKVIDTGMYSLVRHPMYLAACIMFLSIPLTLGSYYALIPAPVVPALLWYRIKNEEKTLEKDLKGYKAYMKKVRYRVIPWVW